MANDFSADPHCLAVYRFENGALTTDSKGSNTLVASASSLTADISVFAEGAASAFFVNASTQFFYITDTNLLSTFPLKSGTSNKTISVFTRFRYTSFASDGFLLALWAKYDNTGENWRTMRCTANNTGGTNVIRFSLGATDGSTVQHIIHGTTLSTGTWYSVVCSYQDSDKGYGLFLRDSSGDPLGTDLSGTATNNIGLFSADWMIGANSLNTSPASTHDGNIDEFVVFDDVITAAEATSLAKGTYSGSGTGPVLHHVETPLRW